MRRTRRTTSSRGWASCEQRKNENEKRTSESTQRRRGGGGGGGLWRGGSLNASVIIEAKTLKFECYSNEHWRKISSIIIEPASVQCGARESRVAPRRVRELARVLWAEPAHRRTEACSSFLIRALLRCVGLGCGALRCGCGAVRLWCVCIRTGVRAAEKKRRTERRKQTL